jgi:hypothetical protein
MIRLLKPLSLLGAALLLSGLLGGAARAGGRIDIPFDAANFSDPTNIDNPYFFLVEGTTFVYRSMAEDECEVNDVAVTAVTPLIAGVTTREVHDQVWADDDCDGGRDFLAEDTLDWYAQDDDGNVWYLGEDTKEYCDRDHPAMVCSTEGSWTGGVDGEPGIVMLANPTPGTSYQQEFADEAQDMAKVLRINAEVVLTFDNAIDPDEYDGCLKTKEWSPLERGVVEHKYYCPGSGLLLINEFPGGTVRTELVDVVGP